MRRPLVGLVVLVALAACSGTTSSEPLAASTTASTGDPPVNTTSGSGIGVELTSEYEFYTSVLECAEREAGEDFGEVTEDPLFPGWKSADADVALTAARLHDSEAYWRCYEEQIPEAPVLEPITGYGDFFDQEYWEVDWFEVTALLVECANDQGLPLYVSPSGDGVFGFGDAGGHLNDVTQAVVDACRAGLMLPDPADPPDEWVEQLYDYWLEVKQCMEEKGWPVSEPPSREEFVANFPDGGWHPFDLIAAPGVEQPTLSAVDAACPQTQRP